MKIRASIAIVFLLATCSFAQTTPAPRGMKDFIKPAIKNGGFQMADYFLWCSSVIKVDDTYHMFASRWPAKYGLNGWLNYSECVRATSKNLLGPYEFQEVVLQKSADGWDKNRVHNVKIVKAGDKFVLYYISSANSTGYAVADAVTGPWKRSDKAVMNFSNPAPFVKPDGSIYVFGRKGNAQKEDEAQAFTAPSYEGPYTLLNDGKNLLPDHYQLEDPCIWWANDQYNVLVTDINAKATGINKAGTQYFSKDGIKYELVSKDPVFDKTVKFDDGTSETYRRRERPFIYADDSGVALALFTACMPNDGAATVVANPVDHYVPKN